VSEIILGCDLSLTSPAVVALRREGGEAAVEEVHCAASKVADVGMFGRWRFVPEPKKLPAKTEEYRMQRLRYLASRMVFVFQKHRPSHVAIEDYATAMTGPSFYTIEFTGMVKLWLFQNRIPFRLYSPKSVKLFAAERGDARKEEMRAAALRRWGFDAEAFGKTARDDVADATAIAQLLHAELSVRDGSLSINDVDESAQHVLTNETKANPINLLSRPFVLQHAEG